ncbi:MAG TPA: hypothetical protein VNA89_03110 [Gemmatimonadaceae bacterium]|nr:hypothetical protein [Gemmatimonadaceae bacterium]
MSDRFDPTPRPDPVARALAGLYAAPAEAAYWHGLEAEIMARVVAGDRGSWWAPFGSWVPVGVAAAALAFLLAGVAIREARTAEAQLAYEAVLRTPQNPLPDLHRNDLEGDDPAAREAGREATLRLITQP